MTPLTASCCLLPAWKDNQFWPVTTLSDSDEILELYCPVFFFFFFFFFCYTGILNSGPHTCWQALYHLSHYTSPEFQMGFCCVYALADVNHNPSIYTSRIAGMIDTCHHAPGFIDWDRVSLTGFFAQAGLKRRSYWSLSPE
jgi:hypothetical protein